MMESEIESGRDQRLQRRMPDRTIALDDVAVEIDGTTVLRSVDWSVAPGERWVIVGPNGSGKTTLLRLISAWLRPSAGEARVCGELLGRTDMRDLRRRIGFTSQALADQLRPTMTPHEVALSATNAALETWWHHYDDHDRDDASERLATFGIEGSAAHRPLHTLSAGERQRVLLARAFTGRPDLVVLDEPTAGLDVGGREDLLRRLDAAAASTRAPLVLVTHHLEEIPVSFDRALLLDRGHVVDAGPAKDVLSSSSLSALYGVDLDVRNDRGRWSATACA